MAALALGPVFLFSLPAFTLSHFGFTMQLAGVLVGATSWGFGLRYVRRQLLGPIDGRPTAHEQWLDFIAPTLSLVLIASTAPMLFSLGGSQPSFVPPWANVAPIWFITNGLVGLSLVVLCLRIKPKRAYVFRYISLWSMLISICSVFFASKFQFVQNYFVYLLPILISTCAFGFTKHVQFLRLAICAAALWVYWYAWFKISLYLFFYIDEPYISVRGNLILQFLILLLPSVAVFWPNLRFILMTQSSTNPSAAFEEKPLAVRMRETFNAAITSAWWFVPALWLVSLRYQLGGIAVDVAPLAVPLAVLAGWRCGVAATIPVIVGSLPFVAEAVLLQDPTIASPGGFWPVAVLPLLVHLVSDQALRTRILSRGRASPVDCAMFVLCLVTVMPKSTLNPGLAVSVDPSWLAGAIGFLIGASRMRWREPAMAFAASFPALIAVVLEVWDFDTWAFSQPLALSAASFFCGRAWRSFVVPETARPHGIGTGGAIVLMLLGACAAVVSDIVPTGPTTEFGAAAYASSLLLLALAGGILVRKRLTLGLLCWIATIVLWAGPAVLAQIFLTSAASTLVSVIGFAVLGYHLEWLGEAGYARALGLVAQALPRMADRGIDADRDHADGGDFSKRTVA